MATRCDGESHYGQAPTKPRGKPDKIGEQEITAQLNGIQNLLEFVVISVKKLGMSEAGLKVQQSNMIRRKPSTIEQGDCYKLSDSNLIFSNKGEV